MNLFWDIANTLLIPKDTTVVGAMSAATQAHNTKATEFRKDGKIVNVIALVNHMFMHGLR